MRNHKVKLTDEQRQHRRAARMRDADTVLNELRTKAPHLLTHIVPDRDWLWYVGPELRGDENAPTREILKDAGFIWAKGGHEVVDEETGESLPGSWGHCCAKPVKFRRRGEKTTDNESTDDSGTTVEGDPFAALAALNVA